MRILIVDDQRKARISIRALIEKHYPQATAISEAGDITSALELTKTEKPDVVLLDIKMPGGSGFDLLKQLMPLTFKLIFITAYEEYAVQAFKFSALDYILKPLNTSDLITALEKAHKEIGLDKLNTKLDNFINNMGAISKEIKKIVVNSKDSINVININDIIRCEAADSQTTFHLAHGKTLLSPETLKVYDEMLSPFGFYRSHHSHLINSAHIIKFDKERSVLEMSDTSSIPVSVRKKDQLLDVLQKI
jgi:two-component system LytT family response regulator